MSPLRLCAPATGCTPPSTTTAAVTGAPCPLHPQLSKPGGLLDFVAPSPASALLLQQDGPNLGTATLWQWSSAPPRAWTQRWSFPFNQLSIGVGGAAVAAGSDDWAVWASMQAAGEGPSSGYTLVSRVWDGAA